MDLMMEGGWGNGGKPSTWKFEHFFLFFRCFWLGEEEFLGFFLLRGHCWGWVVALSFVALREIWWCALCFWRSATNCSM